MLMQKHQAHSCTDVTGFGILGHAANLAEHTAAAVDIEIHSLPIIAGMLAVNNATYNFKLKQGWSAETSGGLLICIPASSADAFIADIMAMEGYPAWVVGSVVEGSRKACVSSDVSVLEV